MLINGIQSDAYADLGDAWLREQTARLMQKHLQFGQRCQMDVDALLARSAQSARVARAAAVLAESHRLAANRFRRAMIDGVGHCSDLEDPFVEMPRLSSSTEAGTQTASKQHRGAKPTILGEFSPINRSGASPRDEWMAVLSDLTEIVIVDVGGKPSSLGITKALSIVQNRAYLEARARQLLKCLTGRDGDWHLKMIDFGVEAQRHDCEFLMCFAFQATNGDLSVTSPYAEIGFALLKLSHAAPIFVLSIRTAIGFDGRSTLHA